MKMRKCAPLEDVPAALTVTGFVLENYVTTRFKANGWGVIASKYYIDDVDGRARELDLLAYKSRVR